MQRIEDFKFLTVIIDIFDKDDFSFVKRISFKKPIEKYVFIIFYHFIEMSECRKNCDKTQRSIHRDSKILRDYK